MGFGSKLKGAFSSDKSNLGSRRRKAPGAYPESSIDIPRSETATTWQTTQTHVNRPTDDPKPESIGEEANDDEYTHIPPDLEKADDKPSTRLQDEDEDEHGHTATHDAKRENARLHKSNGPAKNPYWGDCGKVQPNELAADENMLSGSDADSGIAAVGRRSEDNVNTFTEPGAFRDEKAGPPNYANYGNDPALSNIPSNTHPALRGTAGTHFGDENENRFHVPTNSVNRGRAVLVDDDAAKATSMAASQLSQGDFGRDYESSGRTFDTTGYGHRVGTMDVSGDFSQETYPSVQRKPTVNGRGDAVKDTQDYSILPIRYYPEHSYSPEPVAPQNMATYPPGRTEVHYPYPQEMLQRQTPTPPSAPPPRGQINNTSQSNNTSQNSTSFPVQAPIMEEQSSPKGGSETSNGESSAKSPGGDHYGPGHVGARVMHRCKHCGNDNDITKYFSKDVVYRLS